MPDVSVRMCIDYRAVKAITAHIEDILHSMHGSCWFTKLDLAACYHEICIATADRQTWPSLILVCTSGESCRLAWRTHPASSCVWWKVSWSQWNANSLLYILTRSWFTAIPQRNTSYMSLKCLTYWQNMVSRPNEQNAPGLVRKSIFAAVTLTRTASMPRNITPMR